jgi:hypothetical protein
VLRNVSFRRSAGIRIRRNADGASERAQRQLATTSRHWERPLFGHGLKVAFPARRQGLLPTEAV